MSDDLKDNEIRCPGCGVVVPWLSNCGRYACSQLYGFPIVLDPVKRLAFEKEKQNGPE